MLSVSNIALQHPTNWQDFEDLCWRLWRAEWNDPGTQRNGRQGQQQHGVDVFGHPSPNHLTGVQCKGKNNYQDKVVTDRELKREVAKAKVLVYRP